MNSSSFLPIPRPQPFQGIEWLESRIAPAAVLADVTGRTATWIDVDGDHVTLTISKGTLLQQDLELAAGPNGGAILQHLDLTATEFTGASLTITAHPDPINGGDGAVNVGHIDATGHSLGNVKIAGDLSMISAGDPAATKAKFGVGIASLTVRSMGLFGDANLDSPGQLVSDVFGRVGAFKVAGNVQGVLFNVGGTFGSIGVLSIKGSLVGGADADTGRIVSSGDIGTITIKGDVVGGDGQRSGAIEAGGNIGILTVAGSVIGGKSNVPENDSSGFIRADGNLASAVIRGALIGGTQQNSGVLSVGGNAGPISVLSIQGGTAGTLSGAISVGGDVTSITVTAGVTGGTAEDSGVILVSGNTGRISIGGDVMGGTADHSGAVLTSGTINSLAIGGSIYGGSADQTGIVLSAGRIGKLSLRGNLIGGDLADSASESLEKSGFIGADAIGALRVGGSIRAGVDYNPTSGIDLVDNASIRVANNIGSLFVAGNISGTGDTEVHITARGTAIVPQNSTKDSAFGSITIVGTVSHTEILSGYNTDTDLVAAAVNPNAQIGAVVVGGSWIASDLVTGAAYNENFGDGTDIWASGPKNVNIFASIASITIGGQVVGTAEDSTDHFGFIAQQVTKFQLGTPLAPTKIYPLNQGPRNDNDPVAPRLNVGSTLDTRIFETFFTVI